MSTHSTNPHTSKDTGIRAKASAEQPALGALGGVPHMLRGNLMGFSLSCMEGSAFNQCTACSDTVVRMYRQQGWGMVLRVTQVREKNAFACYIGGRVNVDMFRQSVCGAVYCMESSAFNQCTACSDTVVRMYRQQGWSMVLRATQVRECVLTLVEMK